MTTTPQPPARQASAAAGPREPTSSSAAEAASRQPAAGGGTPTPSPAVVRKPTKNFVPVLPSTDFPAIDSKDSFARRLGGDALNDFLFHV